MIMPHFRCVGSLPAIMFFLKITDKLNNTYNLNQHNKKSLFQSLKFLKLVYPTFNFPLIYYIKKVMGNKINVSISNRDSSTLERLQNGDIETFQTLFRDYYSTLVEFSNYFINDLQVAENIVQDVFLAMWENRERLHIEVALKTYLYSATKKESLRYLRDQKIKRRHLINMNSLKIELASSQNSDDNINQKEIQKAIEEAIYAMPEKRRIIFGMYRFDDFTYLEIAKIQGISIKTVETQMMRALKFLRKRLSHLVM